MTNTFLPIREHTGVVSFLNDGGKLACSELFLKNFRVC